MPETAYNPPLKLNGFKCSTCGETCVKDSPDGEIYCPVCGEPWRKPDKRARENRRPGEVPCERCGDACVRHPLTGELVCPTCSSEGSAGKVTTPTAWRADLVEPSLIIPFAIDEAQAVDALAEYLRNQQWHP